MPAAGGSGGEGGKPGQNGSSMGCPTPGLLALPWHLPAGACAPRWGGCPCVRGSGGLGEGACPLLVCTCMVGRGEALHLIILRIFLCCGCCYRSAWTLPALCLCRRAQGRKLNQLGCFNISCPLLATGGMTKNSIVLYFSAPHRRGQSPSLQNTGSSLQHRMHVPHFCYAEQVRGCSYSKPSLFALAP